MPTVETARGKVDSSRLGRVLCHEHVVNVTDWIQRDYPDLSWETTREEATEKAGKRLAEIKSHGIDTMIDCTAMGHSRDVRFVAEANAMADINIVCATGLYTFDALPHFLDRRPPLTAPNGSRQDIMIDMFVRDITSGIQGTTIKAGIIKCATDKPGITRNIDRILRAVAWAHRMTGAPITTHTDVATKVGLDQQRIFREEGVDLTRVVIGHSGDSSDFDYLGRLLDAGSFIGADRFGLFLDGWPTLEQRINTVKTLVNRGYEDQILLSHDACLCTDWRPFSGPSKPKLPPEWHHTYIVETVLPAMREAGISDRAITKMLVDNPRRLLEAGGPY